MVERMPTERVVRATSLGKHAQYSEGSSPTAGQHIFAHTFSKLTKLDQDKRCEFMWNLVYRKLRGAVIVVKRNYFQKVNIFNSGFRSKLNLSEVENAIDPDEDERVYQKKLNNTKWLMFPKNKFKQGWDIWVMLLLIYTATIVPYTVCFYDETGDFGFLFDLVMDLSFTIDIILTFFTAILLKSGRLELSRGAIAWHYITGYFVLDVVTTFPY